MVAAAPKNLAPNAGAMASYQQQDDDVVMISSTSIAKPNSTHLVPVVAETLPINQEPRLISTTFTLLDTEEEKEKEQQLRTKSSISRWDMQDEYEEEFIDDSELVQAGGEDGTPLNINIKVFGNGDFSHGREILRNYLTREKEKFLLILLLPMLSL